MATINSTNTAVTSFNKFGLMPNDNVNAKTI